MHILIATSRFEDLAGSEITVLEYAIELTQLGHVVSIASLFYSDRFSEDCVNHQIHLGSVDDPDFISYNWDLIWVFHQPTYHALFAKWNYSAKYVIFSSLSHFEPLEALPIEVIPINLITTNSVENYEYVKENYSDYILRTHVLPNSIPSEFLKNIKCPDIKEKVVIVSNHVPEEILELKNLIIDHGGEVDIIGIGHIETKVTPELLSNYKFCISIGKTVQYCLALKIPVYCYDHFGGPGWITKENINEAAAKNFSGRCTNRRYKANYIFNNIKDDKIPNEMELEFLKDYALENFNLKENISKSIDLAKNITFDLPTRSQTEKHILTKSFEIYMRDTVRQKEYKDAYFAESKLRIKAERTLLELNEKINVEYEKKIKIESELSKIRTEFEKEKLNNKELLQQLEFFVKSNIFKKIKIIKSLVAKIKSN